MFKNTVAKITKNLTEMVDQLHALAATKEDEANKLDDQITVLATKRLYAFTERDRALNAADKISALFD